MLPSKLNCILPHTSWVTSLVILSFYTIITRHSKDYPQSYKAIVQIAVKNHGLKNLALHCCGFWSTSTSPLVSTFPRLFLTWKFANLLCILQKTSFQNLAIKKIFNHLLSNKSSTPNSASLLPSKSCLHFTSYFLTQRSYALEIFTQSLQDFYKNYPQSFKSIVLIVTRNHRFINLILQCHCFGLFLIQKFTTVSY